MEFKRERKESTLL